MTISLTVSIYFISLCLPFVYSILFLRVGVDIIAFCIIIRICVFWLLFALGIQNRRIASGIFIIFFFFLSNLSKPMMSQIYKVIYRFTTAFFY
jgi:tryptophan-rich sensory protein